MINVLFMDDLRNADGRGMFFNLDDTTKIVIQYKLNDGYSSTRGIADLSGVRRWLVNNCTDEVIIDTGWTTSILFYSEEDAVMFKLSEWAEQLPQERL